MKVGDKVRIKPTSVASEELRDKVATLGDKATGEVGAVTEIGNCTVILPPGIKIEGHSRQLNESQHYIDLHYSHLQPANDQCPRCGALNGRHRGGCALAPEMHKTPEGIGVRKTPRKYLGDADV